jgi:hypothetical protein
MSTARLLYPAAGASLSSFNLLLLSEAFLATERNAFTSACTTLIDALLSMTPFNLGRRRPWLNVFSYFVDSGVSGVALGATAGDTAFRSTLDATERLALDSVQVNSTVTTLEAQVEGAVPGVDLWSAAAVGRHGGAVVVLLPATSSARPVSGETCFVPTPSSTAPPGPVVRFVATTIDGAWPTLVAREIASRLGLAGEFELDDPGWTQPSSSYGALLGRAANVAYFAAPPTTPPDASFKWYDELDALQHKAPLPVTPHSGAAGVADHSLPASPFPDPTVRLVEGGAGYHTKVYRANDDCLMRRRIGGALSPKLHPAPFCTICTRTLTRALG